MAQRTIKQALLGKGTVNKPIHVWNATPSVDTVTPSLTFTETSGLFATSGNPNVYTDEPPTPPQDPDPQIRMGVGRTNITLSSIPTGKSFKYGMITRDLTGSSIAFVVAVFAPASLSLDDIRSLVMTTVIQGDAYPADYIAHMAATFNGNFNGITAVSLTRDEGGNAEFNLGSDNVSSYEDDMTSIMIIGREMNGDYHVGRQDKTASESDIDSEEPAGVPVFEFVNELTLHYVIASYNYGNGHSYYRFEPSLTTGDSAFDVANTSFVDAGYDQEDWDIRFPAPTTRPQVTTYTPSAFPEGLEPGVPYLVQVDGEYAGPPILVSSKTLENGQYVVFTNAAEGSVDFEIMAKDSTLKALTEVVENILPAYNGEEIAFVRNGAALDGDTVLPLSNRNRIFDSFQAAYDYLITLPKSLKKRVVLDDRGTDALVVNSPLQTSFYELMRNNITLSTYQAYHAKGYNRAATGQGTFQLDLHISVDGLSLEFFEGHFFVSDGQGEVGNSLIRLGDFGVITDDARNIMAFDKLRIGNGCRVLFDDGTISIADNTTVYANIGNNSEVQIIASVTNQGQLVLHNGQGSVLKFIINPGVVAFPQFLVKNYKGEVVILDPVDTPCVAVETVNDFIAPFFYDNVIMVRKPEDIGVFDENGYDIQVPTTGPDQTVTYFIVGTIDLGQRRFHSSGEYNGTTIRLMGFPGHSKLVSDSPILNPGGLTNFFVDGVELASRGGGPAITHFGRKLDLRRCHLRGYAGLTIGYSESVVMRETTISGFDDGSGDNTHVQSVMTWACPCRMDISDLTIWGSHSGPLMTIPDSMYTTLLLEGLKVILPNDALAGQPIGLIKIDGTFEPLNTQLLPNSLIVKDVCVDYVSENPLSFRTTVPAFMVFDGTSERPLDITSTDRVIVDEEIAYLYYDVVGGLSFLGNPPGTMLNNVPHDNDEGLRIGFDGGAVYNKSLGVTAWRIRLEGTVQAPTPGEQLNLFVMSNNDVATQIAINIPDPDAPVRFIHERTIFIAQNGGFALRSANPNNDNPIYVDFKVSLTPA